MLRKFPIIEILMAVKNRISLILEDIIKNLKNIEKF
jgi:hypothetical protein